MDVVVMYTVTTVINYERMKARNKVCSIYCNIYEYARTHYNYFEQDVMYV